MKKMLMVLSTVLAGCAGLSSVTSDVSSFGEWPADRKPGTYAFDRLPSQQADAVRTATLETAARGALAKAGFTPAAPGQAPDALVQVGARTHRADNGPWADPLWWQGGFGYWRRGPWVGPGPGPYWGLYSRYDTRYDTRRYDVEAALLIRDRASGKPLFEARANSAERADATALAAMYEAALMDFPRLGLNPRRVVVPLAQ